jgi:hypothetical protein
MPARDPIYDPGHAISGRATGAAVTAFRFVMVAATKPDGEPTPIKHALAAKWPIGVVADAGVQDGPPIPVYGTGFVCTVLAGGTGVTAGEAVEVLDTGTIQDLASGHKVGVAISTAAAAAYALVRVSI